MKTTRLFLVSFLIITVSMLTGWRSHRHHKKHKAETPIEDVSIPKKLDLSLPLKIEEKSDMPVTQSKIEKPKKIKRDIELEPQTILSAEPENDKIKSFDGAGLSINIKR
ncbi:MAG: hypothetical protein WBI40_08640 [Methylococcaceae bacterium]